jgi:hypothetical protein
MGMLRDEDDDNVSSVEPKDGADVDTGEETSASTSAKEPLVDVIEDDGSDDRLSSTDESDDEPRQQRTRETAAERRARAKLAKERDKKELDFQRRELARQDALIADLQRNQTVSRVTDLDTRISTALAEAETYDRIFGAAITAKNGDDARQAAAIRDAAKERANAAAWEKQQVVAQANRPVQKPVPYLDKAQAFMAANPWYNPKHTDEDSRIVQQLDEAVSKEYIPTSDAYWNELQRRVQKNVPHRFKETRQSRDPADDQDDEPDTRQRRGPPTGGSSRSNSSTSTQIRLSPERVAAMKEAGAWDDPVLRTRMAKAYANYDKQQN